MVNEDNRNHEELIDWATMERSLITTETDYRPRHLDRSPRRFSVVDLAEPVYTGKHRAPETA